MFVTARRLERGDLRAGADLVLGDAVGRPWRARVVVVVAVGVGVPSRNGKASRLSAAVRPFERVTLPVSKISVQMPVCSKNSSMSHVGGAAAEGGIVVIPLDGSVVGIGIGRYEMVQDGVSRSTSRPWIIRVFGGMRRGCAGVGGESSDPSTATTWKVDLSEGCLSSATVHITSGRSRSGGRPQHSNIQSLNEFSIDNKILRS